jgi:hypothetical protein
MKKLYYILTSLILLLPNLSFGQQQYTNCSQFVHNYETINTFFSVGDSSYYNVEADEILDSVVLAEVRQLSLERPGAVQVYIRDWTGSGRVLLTENGIFSDTGSSLYVIRSYQTGCNVTTVSLNVTVSPCNTPAITTTDNVLTLGETLKLTVFKFSDIGLVPEPKILFTGPNNFRAGPWSWDSITGGNEEYEFTLLNNFKGFNAGKYYATFITAGCNTISDSINIVGSYNSSYIQLPFIETFDQFRYNTTYPKWTFTGNINNQGLSRGYWHGTVTDYQTSYNCLIHGIGSLTSYKNDTIVSPIFVNTVSNDTTSLKLSFDLASSIRRYLFEIGGGNQIQGQGGYDTLIVNAYFNNSNTPVTLRKISGLDLLTSGIPTKDSIYVPKIQNNSFFKTQEINLSNYDTCSTVRFHFIHKATINPASTSILLDNIAVFGMPKNQLVIPPSISADSVINFDPHFNLTLHFPENSNTLGYSIYFRRKFSEKNMLFGKQNLTIEQQQSMESFKLLDEGDIFTETDGPILPAVNDTTVTIPIRFIPNGIYEFRVKTKYTSFENNKLAVFPYYSNIIPVLISFNPTPIKKPILLVDSIYNNDKNFRLTLNVPENHNSMGYQIYENNNVIHYGLIAPISDTNFVFHDTTIVFNRTNVSNGTRQYKAELVNPLRKKYNNFSDILNVTVDYSSIPIGLPQISIDSLNNKDKNFNIFITLPSNNNGDEYGLIENNKTIESIKITDSKSSVNKILPITGKPNGTYIYNSYVKKGTRIVKSSSITVTVNYTVPPTLACTTDVIAASNKTKTNFTYSFKLNRNCSNTGYKALFYAGNNANGFSASTTSLTESQVKLLTWTPTNGTPRNGFGPTGNIQLTQNEIKTGFFNRKVDTPLSFGNKWYRVDIVCTSCNQLNKTRTAYFYVTN